MLRKHQMNFERPNKQTKRTFFVKIPPVAWVIVLFFVLVFGALGIKTYQKFVDLSYSQKYADLVEYWAEEYEVDPLLIYTFIRTESGFNPQAQSNVDARGLMQITSDTFDWIKSKIAAEEELVFDDLYDPAVNIRFGTYYVSRCLARYQGDVATAAAAYHSGWGTVDALLSQDAYSEDGSVLAEFPYNQMKNYVVKIASCYQKYNELYGS